MTIVRIKDDDDFFELEKNYKIFQMIDVEKLGGETVLVFSCTNDIDKFIKCLLPNNNNPSLNNQEVLEHGIHI